MSQTQKTTTYYTSNEKFIQRAGDEVQAQKLSQALETKYWGQPQKSHDERKEFRSFFFFLNYYSSKATHQILHQI